MKRFACSAVCFAILAMAFSTAQAQPAVAEPDTQAAAAGPTVTLLNPGQEPRTPIRFRPAVGVKQAMVMTMDMQQQMTMGGVTLPIPPLPVQKITIEFSVGDVASNGDVSMAYEYTDWEVVRGPNTLEQMAAAIEASVKPMVGTKGAIVLTDRGVPKDATINVPDGVPAQMRAMVNGSQDSIKQVGVAVPAEPVGVGAEWTVAAKVNTNGMELDQTATYKLLAVEGGRYRVGVRIKQDAEQQKISPPGLPPGADVTLSGLDSSGEGEIVLDSTSIVPKASKIEMQTATDLQVQAGGQNQAMSTKMTMKLGLAPAGE